MALSLGKIMVALIGIACVCLLFAAIFQSVTANTSQAQPSQPTVNHTFSVYGTVLEDNGTPISGATIGLLEPVGNSYDPNGPWVQSTITDDRGNFQFANITTGSETCDIVIRYPDQKQYFPPGNSFRLIQTSGTQYVNVTRIRQESDAPPLQS
jgi:hypothetical protein